MTESGSACVLIIAKSKSEYGLALPVTREPNAQTVAFGR